MHLEEGMLSMLSMVCKCTVLLQVAGGSSVGAVLLFGVILLFCR